MNLNLTKMLPIFSYLKFVKYNFAFLKDTKIQQIKYKKPFQKGIQNLNSQKSVTQLNKKKYYPKNNNQIQQFKSSPVSQRQKNIEKYSNEEQLNFIEQLKMMDLKPFSMACHKILLSKTKSQLIWSTVQGKFVQFLQPTTDPQKIRSYSKIFYSLSKSKMSSLNYQLQMSLILPFASHQSFTQIVVSMSRLGPLSQQFSHIIQKFYYKKKSDFNSRERVQINYTLTKNGRTVDKTIIQIIDFLNLVQIISMLRSFDNSSELNADLLVKCTSHILARKSQMNVLDLADLINLYTKFKVISKQILEMLEQQYGILARNINQQAFQKIWEYVPQALNQNLLSINLINEMKRTIKIFKQKQLFSQKIWDKIQRSFQKITNLEVRVKLQKIQ